MRKIQIRRSLIRHSMILGGERSLVLLSALNSSMVGFTIAMGKSFILGLVCAFTLWGFMMFLLKTMGKIDPIMSQIFKRATRYKSFYPAKGRMSL
jgi:type IV secretory pathway TrbD component